MVRRNICLWTSFIYVLITIYITAIFMKVSEAGTLNYEECIPVCDSKDCVYIANAVLSHMNADIDPCDNFNSFLCGGYEQRFGFDDFEHMVPDAWKKMQQVLIDIIMNTESEPGSAAAKVKTVYVSCIKHGSSDLKGIQIFNEILNNIGIKNWPKLSPDFKFTEMNIGEILKIIFFYAPKSFFKMTYGPKDYGNENEVNVLKVAFDFDESIRREEAVDVLKYFDLELEDIEILLKDYDDVQSAVSNLYQNVSCEDCSDIQVDCRHQRNDDLFDLCQTVNMLLQNVKWNINTNKEIILSGTDNMFSKVFFNFLKSLPQRSVANFFAMKLFYANYEHLNFYLRRIKTKYAPFQVDADKDAQCLKLVIEFMNLVLQNAFIRQLTQSFEVEKILSFYKDHRSKVFNMVVNQDWILPDYKIEVQNMVKDSPFALESLINFMSNDTFVNEHYKTFHPTEDFFTNILQLKKFKKMEPCRSEEYSCLFYCRDVYDLETCTMLDFLFRKVWYWDGQSVDWRGSYYTDIGFGVIGSPLSYSPGQIKEINYVNLAGIVGHEFGHSIDKYIMDAKYRKLGVLSSSANETTINFQKRRECVVKSIEELKYDYLNETLEGEWYLTEILADSVGITLIDKFLKDSVIDEFLLPGISFSTSQFLYMSAIQMYCGKYNREQELRHRNYKNTHPPSPKRLLFMTRNSRKFSEIFQCPLGSFMNPSTKCVFLD